MILFTKNAFYCFFLLFSMSLIAMEQQDLQLQNPREKDGTVYFDCSVMITHNTDHPIQYAISQYHTIYLYNKPSTPHDPLVVCDIIESHIDHLFWLLLPVKQVIHNSDGDTIQFYVKPEGGHFKNKHFKNKPAIFTIKLTKNPNLLGETFAEQLKCNLHNFFIQPSVIDPDNTQELEKAGIITSQTITIPILSMHNDNLCHKNKRRKICSHGPNNNGSCIEKIIASAEMPTNQNRFLSLQYREMNGTFKK